MARCEECLHKSVCLHRANIQSDTYAYMGVSYDTEKCEHYKPTADVVPTSGAEKQKLEIWRLQGEAEQLKRNLEQCENGYRQQMHLLQCKLTIAKYEVARAFRQRMNEKMGKHTHLLGKEYVQRIMREIEKEFTEESDEV